MQNSDTLSFVYYIQIGDIDMVRTLVSQGVDINTQDQHGNTALMEASRYGQVNIVKLLLDNGANINATNKNGRTVVDIAWTNRGTFILLDNNTGKRYTAKTLSTINRDALAILKLLILYGANKW